MQKYALASSWVIAPNWPPMKWETAQGKHEQTLQIFPCHHLRPHTLPGLSSVFGKVSQIISGQQAPFSDYEWAKPDFFEKGWDLCLWNGRQLEKERAHVLERKSTGADRGPGGAGDWSKKRMGRILQGCMGHPEHHPISWSGAGRRKRGFKSRRVLPKWNWIGNICAGGNFFKKIIKCMRLGQTGSTVSPDNLMFKSLIIFCICTRPKYKYGQWTVSTGH